MATLRHAWRITRDLLRGAAKNGKWWLLPLVVVSLLLVALVVAGGTPLAPFIYSVF